MTAVDISGRSWVVYGLYDSRAPKKPFYIGMTKNMAARGGTHSGAAGPAYREVKAIRDAGAVCTIEAIEVFADKAAARELEMRLIATVPGIVNRDVGKCRRALGLDPHPRADDVGFIMSIVPSMAVRLEAERAKRGLRSRAETIRVLLEEALK